MCDEVSNNLDASELGGILIKPDTIASHQQELMITDIINSGYEMVLRKDFLLTEEDVEVLYPDVVINPIGRKKILEYLANQPAILLAVRNIEGRNATSDLHTIKGDKLKKTGLRGKYNQIEVSDEDILNRNSQYYKYIMINNIHVFDSLDLFVEFLERKNISIKEFKLGGTNVT